MIKFPITKKIVFFNTIQKQASKPSQLNSKNSARHLQKVQLNKVFEDTESKMKDVVKTFIYMVKEVYKG